MTYESLLHDLNQAYMYFMTLLSRFLNEIKQHPVLMLSLFILIALPVLIFIFEFIFSLSDSSEDMTSEGFRIYKYFRSDKFKKKSARVRYDFHKMKKSFQQKKLQASIEKLDSIPLKKPYINKANYDLINSTKKVNSSSVTNQRSSANIDVEYDEENN